jgi:hypothetical protein
MINYDNPENVKQAAFRRGWFWDPSKPNGHNVLFSDLSKLAIDSTLVRDALITGSQFQYPEYAASVRHVYNGRAPYYDGIVGRSMKEMLQVERCGCPDFVPPNGTVISQLCDGDDELKHVCDTMCGCPEDAIDAEAGNGNWRGCHGVGPDFHSVIAEMDLRLMPSKMEEIVNGKPILWHWLTRKQVAYAKHGLLWRFRLDGKDYLTGDRLTGNTNTVMSFVTRSSGWIGLAILGYNQTCNDEIWKKYLATYRPGDYIRQWFTLGSHEGGHNCGANHMSGDPVMHPSIRSNSPWLFAPGSAFARYLDKRFGGIEVDIPGGDDPDPPDKTLEERVEANEFDIHVLQRLYAKEHG